MTLRHLRIFMEVCRRESITAAAEAMNMAQPAVSYAIREMESYYGTKLFERMNRRLYITEAGTCLLRYAEAVLGQMEEAREVLQDIHAAAKIRIGANVSYGSSRLPKLLAGFSHQFPQIPLYTLVQNSRQIETCLLQNELDFGIIDAPANPQYFKSSLVGKDKMTVACALDSPASKRITVRELLKMPLLLRELGSGSRGLTEELFEKYHQKPEIMMESISIEALVEACCQGLGMLLLPKEVLKPFQHRLREIQILDADMERKYYFVYHKSKFLTKSMKCLKEYVDASNVC